MAHGWLETHAYQQADRAKRARQRACLWRCLALRRGSGKLTKAFIIAISQKSEVVTIKCEIHYPQHNTDDLILLCSQFI